MLQIHDLKRVSHNTYPFTIKVKDSDGDAMDISAWDFTLDIASSYTNLQGGDYTATIDGEIEDGTGGEVSFTPESTQVGTLGTFYYQVTMRKKNASYLTVLRGVWEIV